MLARVTGRCEWQRRGRSPGRRSSGRRGGRRRARRMSDRRSRITGRRGGGRSARRRSGLGRHGRPRHPRCGGGSIRACTACCRDPSTSAAKSKRAAQAHGSTVRGDMRRFLKRELRPEQMDGAPNSRGNGRMTEQAHGVSYRSTTFRGTAPAEPHGADPAVGDRWRHTLTSSSPPVTSSGSTPDTCTAKSRLRSVRSISSIPTQVTSTATPGMATAGVDRLREGGLPCTARRGRSLVR